MSEKNDKIEVPIIKTPEIEERSWLKQDIDAILEQFKNSDWIIEFLETPPEWLNTQQKKVFNKLQQNAKIHVENSGKTINNISSLAKYIFNDEKTQNFLWKIKTFSQKWGVEIDKKFTQFVSWNKNSKTLEEKDSELFLDFLSDLQKKLESPGETLARLKIELEKLKWDVDKTREYGIIWKFDNFEKSQNDTEKAKILWEIKTDLTPHFSEKWEKIFDDLETLYTKSYDKFTWGLRKNQNSNLTENFNKIDFSKIDVSGKKWFGELSTYFDNITSTLQEKLKKEEKPIEKIKIEKLILLVWKMKSGTEKLINEEYEKLNSKERQEKIKENVKKLTNQLKLELNKDESAFILNSMHILSLSYWEKFVWNSYLLDKNLETIGEIKQGDIITFNPPNNDLNSIDLLSVLPTNASKIKVNQEIYTRGNTWYFANHKKERLTLQALDKFEITELKEIRDSTKKIELEATVKNQFDHLKNAIKRQKSGETKEFQTPEFKKSAETIWDVLENVEAVWWLTIDVLPKLFEWVISKWEAWAIWIVSLLELFARLVWEIFWIDFWLGSSDKSSQTDKPSETTKPWNTETASEDSDYKELKSSVIYIKSEKERNEIINNDSLNWEKLKNNIRIKDWRFIRFEKLNTSILKWHDLWLFQKKGSWKFLESHKPYLEEIVKIESKMWVPAEVLINLIYGEDYDWKINPKKEEDWWAFWLWQHKKAAWKESRKLLLSEGITIPENRFESNEKQQIWAAAAYLKIQKGRNWWWDWVLATVAYNAWSLKPEKYKEYFRGNAWATRIKWLIEKDENWENMTEQESYSTKDWKTKYRTKFVLNKDKLDSLTPDDYIISHISYYFDITFDEAKEYFENSKTTTPKSKLYENLLLNKFQKIETKREIVTTLTDLQKLDLSSFQKIKRAHWDMELNPVFIQRLNPAFAEINEILLDYPDYQISITSWHREHKKNTWATNSAHLVWIAIDFHLTKINKPTERLWEIKENGVYSRLLTKKDTKYNPEHAKIRKSIVDIMKKNWMYWWWDFKKIDAMHFHIEERQTVKNMAELKKLNKRIKDEKMSKEEIAKEVSKILDI